MPTTPIRLRWRRPADGYAAEADALTPRTDAVEPFTLHAEDLSDPVALRLVNARSDAELIAFADRHGPLGADAGLSLSALREHAGELRWKMERALTTQTRTGEAVDIVNGLLAGVVARPWVGYVAGSPRMGLEAGSLAHFMALEVGEAFGSGAVMRACLHCRTFFLYGEGTGRRSNGQYCSDRCRTAAMRARRAQEA